MIERVEFFVNGLLIATREEFPYDAVWAGGEPGYYNIYAVAHDNEGNSVVSAVENLMVGETPFTTVELLYPHASISHSFASGSSIPVVAHTEFNYTPVAAVIAVIDNL